MTQSLEIHTYAENAYLEYAMAVVIERALMHAEDGNKPVHRRILYAMRQLGLWSDAKPVKSARIVGDVLGKYHPHGDQSVYDALVRTAQPFSLRYPLVLGQGNFGSRDGDSAAAMRYTESRLAPIARLLLDEVSAGTVDFAPNYDGSQTEPKLLPARLPFSLLNGTEGIAVGMASNVPSHNIREVCAALIAVLRNPSLTTAELMEHLPGPDFPDGAILVATPAEIAQAYESGRGPLRVRARWEKEELSRGQWQVVVTELPYHVSSKLILEQISDLSNPQPPADKKTLTQKQINLKALILDYLDSARDESNKDSAVRLVLTPRTAKVDINEMMDFLMANTSLTVNFSLNNTLLQLDGNPARVSILESLRQFGEFRKVTVKRRSLHEKSVAAARVHILEGRTTVLQNLEEVIHIIRTAQDPQKDLMSKFSLSELQADDILEMRLRQLNNLEGIKLEKELAELRAQIKGLERVIEDPAVLEALIISEIQADCEKYGDDRRTLIQPEEKTTRAVAAKTVLTEPLTVVISKNLWVRAYKGVDHSSDSFVFKASDSLLLECKGTSSQTLALIDTLGRTYSFSPAELPQKGDGVPLSTLIELQSGARPLALLSGPESTPVFFTNTSGLGFYAPLKSLLARPKAGKSFVSLDAGEHLLAPYPLSSISEGYLLLYGADAKLLAIDIKEVPARPTGGKGVVLMGVEPLGLIGAHYTDKAEAVYDVVDAKGHSSSVRLQGEGFLKYVGKRSRKGLYLPDKLAPSFTKH